MKNLLFVCIYIILILSTFSCDPEVENKLIRKEKLTGYAQKGPFITGASVSVSELDSALSQTGRIYSTNTEGSSGSFELKNIELVSPYVLLKADEYYFNEITGSISQSPLTLYALSDIRDVSSVNVNVLTHLERGRGG